MKRFPTPPTLDQVLEIEDVIVVAIGDDPFSPPSRKQTEEEFILQGAQGAQGFQGAQGDDGPAGNQGTQGIGGNQGAQGRQGAQGDVGAQGSQGLQGLQGGIGLQGAQGSGLQGQQGAQGRQGDFGAQGAAGAQGAQGQQGQQGNPAGPTYPLGPTLFTSATAAELLNIPLSDNTEYLIIVDVAARNTGTAFYTRSSVTRWQRAAGGGATPLGSDTGDGGIDNIGVTGLIVIAASNSVSVRYGGSDTLHTNVVGGVYVQSFPLAAAT